MPNPPVVPPLSPRPSLADFFVGLGLPLRAAGIIFRDRTLFWLSVLSSIVTALTLVAVVYFAWALSPGIVEWVYPKPPDGFALVLWSTVRILVFAVLLVVGANTVPMIVLAPLQDPISEATERVCGDFEAPPFSIGGLLRGTWIAIGHTLARMSLLLLGLAVLFPLNFVPGIGSIVWTAVGGLWTTFWVATEYLDAPMARHLYPFGEVRRTVQKRLALSLGLGAAITLTLWVPVVNFFFVPVAIVSGTLLFRGLRDTGDLGPPPSLTRSPPRLPPRG